jgi:hypothetical protein
MIDQIQKKKKTERTRVLAARNCHRPHRSWTIRNKMAKQQEKKNLVALSRSSHIQTMKTTNGATLIKTGAVELHKLLPRCKDHPALVDDDAAKAEVTEDALLLLLLELVEPVVVVPVGGRAVDVPTAVKALSVEVGVVTELGIERDVAGSVVPGMELEDADDDEVSGPGEEIRVMAKAGLVSPESPNRTMM